MMTYPESGWYMSSTSNIAPKFNETIGIIQTVGQGWAKDGRYWGGRYVTRLDYSVPWCLDNGVFTNKFKEEYWVGRLKAFQKYKDTCLFVSIPDVVGNAEATIEQFSHFQNMVEGYPTAFVSQDGISKFSEDIPWNKFDVLFVGGSDHHKLGREGGWIIGEAKKNKKWVHIGRVNSISRMLKFWTADSWDGTHLSFYPSDVKKFHETVSQIRQLKKSEQFYEGMGYYP